MIFAGVGIFGYSRAVVLQTDDARAATIAPKENPSMTTVVYLDARRPSATAEDDTRGRLPVTRFLNDLSRQTGELANDWLFQSVSPEAKRRMLAERGLMVADTAA